MKLFMTAFLLPPGLALVLALLTLYFFKKNSSKTLVFLLLTIFVSWTFSTMAFGRLLSTLLIAQVEAPKSVVSYDSDLIVALTGGMYYGGQDVGWLPIQESYRRVSVAFEVQNIVGIRTPVLITGGKTKGIEHPSEAGTAYAYFDKHRAQITPVLLEESASNTYENALQSAAMAQQRGSERVLLVTSEVHMPRALATFRGRGLNAVPYSVVTIPRGPLSLVDFLPSWQGVEISAKALYEILGITEYVLMGRIKLGDLVYNK